jgi:hypothetical protein
VPADRVELVTVDPVSPRVLATAPAQPGVLGVADTYVSERTADLFAVSLTAGSPTNRDRQVGYVVLWRFGPGDFRAVTTLAPTDPKPVPPPPAPSEPPAVLQVPK